MMTPLRSIHAPYVPIMRVTAKGWRGMYPTFKNTNALVSRLALRRRFGFDVLPATDGGGDYERYVEFFGRVREDTVVRKGMLRIEP
jgi:hypothetical protein